MNLGYVHYINTMIITIIKLRFDDTLRDGDSFGKPRN